MPAASATSSDGSSPSLLQERGSLRTLSDGKSQFIGSSSGVYFVNTVRRAFSDANALSLAVPQDQEQPSPEDCLVPDDEDDDDIKAANSRRTRTAASSQTPGNLSYGPDIPRELGRPPPPELAKRLFMTYFQTWHQFFPFLHGPSLLADMELLYATLDKQTPSDAKRTGQVPLAKVVILQCLFNLACLHGESLPAASQIVRPVDVLSSLPNFAVKSDITSIQALFAAQLLLTARMSLRTAAAVGGLLGRSIFLAGLHRCPARYQELSAEDCDMRKRLFWCIYVIDRYLSQALGHPLGVQDSDVDVCSLSGPELHGSQFASAAQASARGTARSSTPHMAFRKTHNRRPSSRLSHASPSGTQNNEPVAHSPQSHMDAEGHNANRYSVPAYHVEYSRLAGRALELFHKSIHVRSMDPASILSLRTDVNAWWNALPSSLQDESLPNGILPGRGDVDDQKFGVSAFFNLLHSQIVLLINRPWLSLEPSCAEFQAALQTCIGVSRDIITILKRQLDTGRALFWPGYLSATWMAGIILVFACHLHLYPAEKGQREIQICLELLSTMSGRWRLARNCHTILSDLHQTFEANKDSPDNLAPGSQAGYPPSQSLANGHHANADHANKRRRVQNDGKAISDPYQTGAAEDGAAGTPGAALSNPQPGEQMPGLSLASAMWSPVETQRAGVVASDSNPLDRSTNENQPQSNNAFPQVNGTPFGTVTGFGSPGTMGMGMYGFDSDDIRWAAQPGSLSNWDGGMPDVFAAATWESLLHVVNQDNQAWDDAQG